jgi:LysR family hydrogen peroxide-inducible transcriptional activator
MELRLLTAFVETADAGTLSRAARRLGVSQPALTLQVQRLEADLGAPLFARHARGVTLTPAGQALYPRARRILDDVQAAEAAVRHEEAAHGALRVGAIPTIAPYVLPAALAHLDARGAGARLTIVEDRSAALERMLLEHELDVAIAAQPHPFHHLDLEPVGDDALLVAVPATHPSARTGRITLRALREAPAVTLDQSHCLGTQIADFCSARAVLGGVACRTAQLATVLELVAAGAGVSIVPAMAAAQHASRAVAFVRLADHALHRQVVAAWRPGGERPAAARAFVDGVRAVLQAQLAGAARPRARTRRAR